MGEKWGQLNPFSPPGFIVYPSQRLLKDRKAVQATRRLGERFATWQAGEISFAEFDATVQGWINHVRYAYTWGLRRHVLGQFAWGPAVE